METRRIGSLEVSLVGLGCNNFGRRLDADATKAVVEAALDAGITFFDTADVYGPLQSEEFLGRALGKRRRDVVVATKFGNPVDDQRRGAKPAYVHSAVEDSLRRLGTDRIDLYQLHRPDPETPIGDTLEALDALVRAGKVREIGISNATVEQLAQANAAVRDGAARFVSVQNQYSLLERTPEQGVLAEARHRGLAFLPYFPLASGLLTGKYRRGEPPPPGTRLAQPGGQGRNPSRFLNDRNLETVERLSSFAASHGHTVLDLAISWLAAQVPVASVIAGATTPAQVRANVAAVGWRLGADDLAAIDAIAPVAPAAPAGAAAPAE
jgi:aryl-alcohol dehydrogenase-like predicted oxidoreductase